MNNIWEWVQICRQTEKIAQHCFILQNKNQLKLDVCLVLLQRSYCKTKIGALHSAKPVAFKRLFALEAEESERSAEGQVKWRKADIPFWLVCLKNKLNQQGGVDGNWIKPSRLPLKNMRFQRQYNLGPIWIHLHFFIFFVFHSRISSAWQCTAMRWEETGESRRDGRE